MTKLVLFQVDDIQNEFLKIENKKLALEQNLCVLPPFNRLKVIWKTFMDNN